jgi:transcriptional regulator with XRE-family HTH domain
MHQVIAMEHSNMAISQDEREFFVALGQRISRLRKESHITQVQLAETLGISQSAMNAYELGHRRVPASALTILAKTLGTSLDELLGETKAATHKRGPAPKWQQQIDAISQLPKTQQRFVTQMLETVLAQANR